MSSRPTFRAALGFWHWLGWLSFGGSAGQIALMHRELVDRRRWVDEATFLHGLNYCMLLPGPEAMQLATLLGWRLHGLRGGLAAGALFVLPSVVLLALLSWLYLRFGQVPAVAAALAGIQAAVLAIVLHALVGIARKVLHARWAWVLAIAAFAALFLLRWPFPLVVLGAGMAGAWLLREPAPERIAAPSRPTQGGVQMRRSLWLAAALLLAWWLPLLGVRLALGADSTAWAMGLFFSKAALVTLGGAYAVLPYVAQQAVEVQQWLSAEQMLTGLGLAESTPGPLIIVLEFVGFVGGWQRPDMASPLASALLGAGITVWATFLPSFLFILPAAPWIERLREVRWLGAALRGITAAVVGAIASLALWFGWQMLRDAAPLQVLATLSIAGAAAVALRRGIGVARVVAVAAVAGGALQWAVAR
ncbi:MAG: chromate efflux transporter [Pseudoxanthomonas suwonensis]|nr:chromate efflux transporter [Pseudoxanthomonas suwonensis]